MEKCVELVKFSRELLSAQFFGSVKQLESLVIFCYLFLVVYERKTFLSLPLIQKEGKNVRNHPCDVIAPRMANYGVTIS